MGSKSINKTIQNYDKYAKEYHEHVVNTADSIYHAYYEKPALMSMLPNMKNKNVMSFGCGSGADLHLAKQQKADKIIGVDPSEGLLEIAQKEHPDVQFINGTVEAINLPSNSQDIIYSSLVMHYIEDWVSALNKINDILKPGGSFVFSCAHPIESSAEYGQAEDNYKYAFLGRKTYTPTDKQRLFGDYMGSESDGIIKKQGELCNIKMEVFHRSFSRMITDIQDSGMVIDKVLEPTPVPDMKDRDKNTYEKLNRIPVFILFRLKKPLD